MSEAERGGYFCGSAMQKELWPMRLRLTADLNFDPGNFADPRTERFGDGFFARQTRRQAHDGILAILPFSRSEEALKEAFTEAIQAIGDPCDRDQIDAAAQHHHSAVYPLRWYQAKLSARLCRMQIFGKPNA